jgi:hypothetical protein
MPGQNPMFAPRRPGEVTHQHTKKQLEGFDLEVGYGGSWVSLNDRVHYRVTAESLAQTAQTKRKLEAQNPVVEGTYLIHVTPENVQETVKVYCYGETMTELHERAATLKMLFEQFDYQVRVTLDAHREYWRCQPADWTMERTHVQIHQGMLTMTFLVPRYPTVTYEALV